MQDLASASNLLGLFAEPTRVRLLRLLADQELSVAELVQVTDVPQSSVSTHLGKLRDAGLVRDRKNGTSTYYALSADMPAQARSIWDLVANEVTDTVLATDRARAEEVLQARHTGFPESIAGEMERHYSPGRTWEALALSFAGLLRLGRVLDIGSGDGAVAEMLAPRARALTCVDTSDALVDAAKKRLAAFEHAEVLKGDMHALPFQDGRFDQVLMLNTLVHSATPAKAVGEAARVLAKGGDLVIVTLDAHDHPDAARSWGHAQQGITPATLRKWLARSGLAVEQCDVMVREKRAPRFDVVVAYAQRRKS
jgi:DNA-binding transcriptional ArsR family regulator/protein-L-isoaspartate O-methyltransferase